MIQYGRVQGIIHGIHQAIKRKIIAKKARIDGSHECQGRVPCLVYLLKEVVKG